MFRKKGSHSDEDLSIEDARDFYKGMAKQSKKFLEEGDPQDNLTDLSPKETMRRMVEDDLVCSLAIVIGGHLKEVFEHDSGAEVSSVAMEGATVLAGKYLLMYKEGLLAEHGIEV